MPKELEYKIRAKKDKGSVGVNVDDNVNTSRRIETRGVAHSTMKNVGWKGCDGGAVGTANDSTLGTRKKK